MKALVIANGPLPARPRFEQALRESDLILCADGGANRALKMDIIPDVVVGDFDSITADTRSALEGRSIFCHRPSQYATDLEKTLQEAVDRGVREVVVIGVTGGRLDHQICNLNILEKFCDRLIVETIDDYGSGRFVRDVWRFDAAVGEQISLFAFRRAERVTTQGLKYPLNEEALEWAVRDGLSNEATIGPVSIQVTGGVLFVYRVSREGATPEQNHRSC